MSTFSPFSLELSGTEGSLVVGGPEEKSVRIRSRKLDDGKAWIVPERLPDALPATARMWVEGVLRGAPIPFDTEQGTQLTELMEYAYKSHREGKQVEIPKR
jgi:predicted dehydrogenase